jgi:TP901 family phage tail tape measure protein
MREYFRYAGGASQTFGKLFTNEFNTIGKVAEERVKKLQTQYIKMGRDTTGAMRAMSVMPATLDMSSIATKTQIAAQKQAIFNQLLKQGSTQLLNFGKNTQWAGRQLMVGFTVPLIAFGSAATKAFTDIETASIKFKKVYGDLGTTQAETASALAQIRALADGYTQYGVAVKDTIALAADAAAAGYKNADLIAQTTSATKLSVLGQIDSQQSLKTTISLQSAFGISAEKLTGTIDFLNAVENQTVVSLDDITTAIPLVSPVIKQLGGSVQDLTYFLTAMKEGGVSAAQGANALKSGLASLINPSTKAKDMLKGLGIDIMGIVQKDQGNLQKTVLDFAKSLDTLDPLTRARAIETMFGKFQFARMSTLFQNITKDGSQASRVLDLMGMSASDLATISQKELGVQGASALTKFKGAIEKLKASIAPVGEMFMKIFTPVIETVGKVLDKFNHLSDGAKKAIAIIVAVIGGLGPVVLMTFGLLANAFANGIKLFATLRAGYQKLTGHSKDLGEQTQYLTMEQLDAAAAAHSLDQSHAKLTQTFTAEAGAVNTLRNAYSRAAVAAEAFRIANPGMMNLPGKKFASGGIVHGPGTGTSDSIPAMVSNGEAIIPAKQTKKYGSLINGIIANNIPGFMSGRSVAYAHAQMPFAPGSAEYAKGIQIAGLEKLAAAFPQFIKVVSNLVIELPQDLNVAMKKGVDALKFKSDYNARQGKTITTAKLGGLDTSNAQNMAALQALEDEIGQATIQLAKQKAAGGKVVVSDEMFAEATRGVIDKYKVVEGAAGRAAQALDSSSKQVGQVRVSAKKGDYLAGLESGQFVRSRTGKQSQNQIMYQGINIGRESSSTPNSFYSGNPISPTGSYKGKAKRAVMVATKEILNEVVDGVVTEAQIKSPSRKARVAGQEIARGGIAGIVDEVKNARAAGQRLGSAATTGVIAGGGMGGGLIPPTGGSNGGNSGGLGGDNSSPKKVGINLERMNSALMGATFGLTTIASVGSMAGGTIGNLSAQVMKYSGLLFGLMSITQLLTQTSILKLAADRAQLASNAMRAVNIASFAKTGSGVTGLGPKLLQLGTGLMKFIGPVGLAAAAITASIVIYKLLDDAHKRQIAKLNAFGDAITTSTAQMKSLVDYFGKTQRVSALNIKTGFKPEDAGKQTAIQSFIASDAYTKYAKPTTTAVSKMSNSDAKKVLNAKMFELLGQGFSKDEIQLIITAIQQEAGKTSLTIDFKKVDIASLGKKSIDNIQSMLKKIPNGLWTEVIWGTGGKKDKATAQFANSAKTVKSYLDSLSTELTSGAINGTQFNKMFEDLNIQIKAMKDPQNQFSLIDATLKLMSPEAAKAAVGITNLKDKMLVVQAVSMGLGDQISKQTLALLSYAGTDAIMLDMQARAEAGLSDQIIKNMKLFNDQYAAAQKAADAAAKAAAAAANPSDYKKGLDALVGYIQGLKNASKAYKILIANHFSAAEATTISSDATLAAAIATDLHGKALTGFIAKLKEYIKLTNDAEHKNNVDAFTAQQKQITDQIAGMKALMQAGMSAEEALNAVNDTNFLYLVSETLAAGKSLDGLKKQYDALTAAKKAFEDMSITPQQAQHDAIIKQADSAIQVINDRIAIAQAEADAQKKIDQISIDTIQRRIDNEQKVIDGYQKTIDDNNHSIDLLNHTMDMTIDRPIAKLQAESDILSNNLTLIDHQAQLVNDQYDKQAAAMELVNKANQDAIAMGKQRISIADALSSGDISAAAQAVQDLRAAQAASQSGAMQGAMDAARKNSIDGLTAGGMTKAQIEQRQYEISQQTFKLEQQRKDLQAQIQVINDANYLLEQNIYKVKHDQLDIDSGLLKDAQDLMDKNQKIYTDKMDAMNKEITAWTNIKLNADLAYDTFTNIQTTTEASRDAAAQLKKTFDDLTSNPPHFNSYEDHYITNYVTTISTGGPDTSLGAGGDQGGGGYAPGGNGNMRFAANGGMIRYFAGGGAARGFDRVPAMLTPGEFVINKAASQAYRPLLESMNSATYPSMKNLGSSVSTNSNIMTSSTDNSQVAYNYNLSVNMNGTTADPNDVANAVLIKIRQLENQRVKGQAKY